VLAGGEAMAPFRVAYTPGHASHHVSYLHEASGWAFTGDVTGVRIGVGPVLAPTPPPDIDLRAWRGSLDLIEEWNPRRLAPMHFGARDDVGYHLSALREHLDEVEAMARDLDEAGFAAAIRARVAAATADTAAGGATAAVYEQATRPQQNFQGLTRYLRVRAQSP
jgi:glyoxylase-like metal-dependent hydrolase (beta-lactamase superfamily II)